MFVFDSWIEGYFNGGFLKGFDKIIVAVICHFGRRRLWIMASTLCGILGD